MVIYSNCKNSYNNGIHKSNLNWRYAMVMHFDKELINPNISRTIRFTPILYEWLEEVKEREGISFNHAVLQCIKNCMEEDRKDRTGPVGSKG